MLDIKLLGRFDVFHEGKRVKIPTRGAQALCAFLFLNPHQPQRRERLAGLLWPDSLEEAARGNLRHELWRLRKAFKITNEEIYLVDKLSIIVNPQLDYVVDAQILEGIPTNFSHVDELMAALTVYEGELLPGFYHEWVFVERQRLHSLYEARMAQLLDLLHFQSRWSDLADWSLRWIAWGTWPEPAYRGLILAYANMGDISKAIITYDRFRLGFLKDLGLQPSEQTQKVYDQIKAGGKFTEPSNNETVSESPIEIETGSLLAPLNSARKPRSNLPKPLTSFIGRGNEINFARQMLASGRLVTIIGPGGVGKTRLAIQIGSQSADEYKDGMYWAELAPIKAPRSNEIQVDKNLAPKTSENEDLFSGRLGVKDIPGGDVVVRVIANSLKVPDAIKRPVLENIIDFVTDSEILLLLDNCEHFIEACAVVVEDLLQKTKNLKVLATSREPLGVPGEKILNLPALSYPLTDSTIDSETMSQYEAVRLFLDRLADIVPGHIVEKPELLNIAEICCRLDGIPLAIELAAARMNMLSAGEILKRLDDRFSLLTGGRRYSDPRHQTLLSAIGWSYDLLTEDEQSLFRCLSIFKGSFTLEAAEAVSTDLIPPLQAVTLLGRLIDKSLLHVDHTRPFPEFPTRYKLLDSIYYFSRMMLEENGRLEELQNNHKNYYLSLAKTAAPNLLLREQAYWYKCLRLESENIRAALDWCIKTGQVEDPLDLTGSLLWIWWWYGTAAECLALSLEILELSSSIESSQAYARALGTAGYLFWILGDGKKAREYIEMALTKLRQINDLAGQAWSMQYLGLVLATEGEVDLADKYMDDVVNIVIGMGDLTNGSFSLAFMGDNAMHRGDRKKAKILYEESSRLLHEMGNAMFEAYPLRRLGYMALQENEYRLAKRYFYSSLELNLNNDDLRGVVGCLNGFAALADQLNLHLMAIQLLGFVDYQLEFMISPLFYTDHRQLLINRERLGNGLSELEYSSAYEWGRNLSAEEALNLVNNDLTF